MLKSTIIVTSIGLIIKLLAFLRDVFIANSFGATWITDSYNISITVTNIIYSVMGIVLTSTLIPLISKSEKEKGEKSVYKLCSNLINFFLIISILIVIIVFIFDSVICTIMAPEYRGEARELTINLIRISSLSMLPMVINSIFNAFLQYKGDFFGANISNLVINLSIIIMMILIPEMSISALIVITVLANYIQIVVQIPWLIKHKFKYKRYIKFDNDIKHILATSMPLLLGVFATQLNSIVDKSIGSSLDEGSISALSYAYKIVALPYSIFGYAIVSVAFPKIAKLNKDSNINKNQIVVFINRIIIIILIIMGFSTTYLIFMSNEVISLIFGRGNFNQGAVEKTALCLIGYSISLAFMAIKDLYIRIFYIYEKNKFVLKVTIISMISNILFNLLFASKLGAFGLALGTSLATIVSTSLCFIKVKNIFKIERNSYLYVNTLKIIFASIFTGICMNFINKFLKINLNITNLMVVIICGVIGIFLYSTIIYVSKINFINEYMKEINNNIRSK